MATDRNVITILVQAIDRASSTLRAASRELRDLEKAESKGIPTTRKLDEAQKDLGTSVQGTTRNLDRQNRSIRELNESGTFTIRTVGELRRELERLEAEQQRANQSQEEFVQQSFFDRVSKANRLLDAQRRLLRDIAGAPIEADAFRRGRAPQARSGTTGRFLGAAGAPGEQEVGEQLSFQVTDIQKLLDLFPRYTAEVRDADEEMRDIRDSARDFFTTLRVNSGTIRQFISDFRELRGREGDFGGQQLREFFRQETDRLRVQQRGAISFAEHDEIERQIRALRVLGEELDGLQVSMEDIRRLGKEFDLPSLGDRDLELRLDAATRAVGRLNDSLGENGLRGHARDVGRAVDRDIVQPIGSRANRVLERFASGLRISRRELDAFAEVTNRRQRSLLDITRFDDTVQIGLRRLARLMVIVATFIPFLVAGFSTIVGAVVALVGGITALAGAFSQLAGVVATLPALFAATAGAFLAFQAVVGPGITAITDRFKEALQIQEQTRKQSTENARATAQAQQAYADAVVRAQEQISDTQERISRQQREAVERERDAVRDLARLKVRNAEEEADLVRDIRRAKRDAAEDARRAEQDYQDVVRENRREEREISAELSARRASLGALRLQGADSVTVGRAQAAVSAVEGQLSRTQAENRKQESEALRAVTRARTDGAQRVGDLERRLARTRRDNNQAEADAERNLFRLRRDSLEQLQDLERQLARQRRDSAQAQIAAAQALSDAQEKQTGSLEDTLRDLEPTERRIVLQLIRIREEWLRLTRSTRLGAERLGERALSFLESRLPAIAERANQFTNVIIRLGEQAFSRFTSAEAIGRVNRILDDALRLTGQLGGAVLDIADAFLVLADAASPVTRHLGDLVEDFGQKLLASVRAGEESGSLEGFFAGTNRVLDQTIEILGNLGSALINVLRIGAPFGEELLADFSEFTRGIERFTEDEGPAIQSFFEDATPVVRALAGLLADVAKELFILGRELIRPDAGGNVFLLQIIEDIREGLPGLREFFQELTQESGPILLDFLESLGRFIGSLIGPQGPFIVFLQVLGSIFDAITALPDSIERVGLAFFAFGGIINNVAGQIRRFVALLTVSSRQVAAGGAGAGGLIAASRGTLFGIAIATLIAFPGLIDKVTAAMDALLSVMDKAAAAFDRFLGLFGPAGDTVGNFLFALAAVEIALRVLAGTTLLRVIRNMRVLIQLFRESQRATVFGRVLETISALFPALSLAIERAIRRFRDWIATQRQARRENQLYMQTNIVSAFSDLIRPIGLAVQALIDYIRAARNARNANRALAASNAQLAFSNVIAGFSGLGNLAGGLGRLLPLLGRIAPLLLRVGGAAGLIVTAALGLDRALEKLDAPKWLQFIASPLLNLDALRRKTESNGDAIERVFSSMSGAARRFGTAITRAMRNVFTVTDLTLRNLQRTLDDAARRLEDFADAAQRVADTTSDFIRARMEATPVPAQRALDALDRRQTLRSRADRRREANEELEEARRFARRRGESLEAAEIRLANLRRRLARGVRSGGLPRDQASGIGFALTGDPLSPEQRRQLRIRIRDQARIVAERRRELNEAEKQVREVAQRRLETLREVAEEEERERLENLVRIQEAEREKEIQAAERRANVAMQAYIDSIGKGKNKMKKARNDLIAALEELGVPPEQTRAWLAGKRLGEDFNTGFAEALADFGVKFKKLFNEQVKKQQLRAPVIIVTDAPTIRKVVNQEITAGDLQRGNPRRLLRAGGGRVDGGEGQAVPIVAHAGEWVLNRSQQWRAALLAGLDRTKLERALFHLVPAGPRFNFALGGVVPPPSFTASGGHSFLTPVSITTSSATVDAEYIARALESRMRQVM